MLRAASCLGPLEYYALVPNVMATFNSAANFLIYVIFAKGFRKKVGKLIARNKIEPDSDFVGGSNDKLHS
jgi:hypothetical protein